MHQVNLSGIDLNLLPPLYALLLRKNVTHAASDVGMSQPAMSRALARLRDRLSDPLLVRGPKGLVRTPRGEALLPLVSRAMADLAGLFEPDRFDPKTVKRTIRIASSDVQTLLIAPRLHALLRQEAPNIDLVFEPYGRDVAKRMEEGRLDFVFALSTTPLPGGATSFDISRDRLALVMRRGHPLAAKPWTLKDYAEVDHVSVRLTDDGLSDLDTLLAREKITRRIALATPHFMAALAAVAQSDAVTTISRHFAEAFQNLFDLEIRDPPLPRFEMVTTLVTASVRASDPALLWLVECVRKVAEGRA
jgi:DNA-binding transcriptional LysR family regulator